MHKTFEKQSPGTNVLRPGCTSESPGYHLQVPCPTTAMPGPHTNQSDLLGTGPGISVFQSPPGDSDGSPGDEPLI